jgi:hypothetical protein
MTMDVPRQLCLRQRRREAAGAGGQQCAAPETVRSTGYAPSGPGVHAESALRGHGRTHEASEPTLSAG